MNVLAFLATILFIPGIPAPATTPRWALLMLVIPILWYRHPNRITVGHLLGACFLAWAALSLSWTFNGYDGAKAALALGLLALIFCAAPLSLRAIYKAMAIGLAINSAVVISQVYGWDALSQSAIPGGLFFNKNFGGELSAMVLAGVVMSRLWGAIPGILPTLILSQCRGAWMALGIAAIVLIYQYNRLAAAVLLSLAGLAGLGLWMRDVSTAQRAELWLDTWDGFRFWGRGLGSFYTTFPEHASRLDPLLWRPSTAHSDLINLTYELGPGVLFLLGLLVYALRARPLRAEHYVLIVFLVEGLVGFPLYIPATAFLAVLVLGSLCRDRPEFSFALARSRVRVLFSEVLSRFRADGRSPAPGGNVVALRLSDADGSGVLLDRDPVLHGPRYRHSRYQGSSRE